MVSTVFVKQHVLIDIVGAILWAELLYFNVEIDQDEKGRVRLKKCEMNSVGIEQKLLILTAGYGEGHTKVAQALKQKFEHYGFRHLCLIDLYQIAHPMMNSISKFLYKKSPYLAACGLDFYGWSYYWTRNMKSDNAVFKWIHKLGVKTLAAIIQNEKPTAIISTFPYGGITEYLKKQELSIPTFTVITDFTLHNRWIHWIPDHYFVAAEYLKQMMISRGIPHEQITVSGIPIRRQFEQTPKGNAYGDGGQRSVLIMSGSYMTFHHMIQLINDLLLISGVKIHVVCGKNKKLKHTLELRYRGIENLNLYGFVEQIHELMNLSSCMITKAGGITLSEAIHVNIPILIFNPLAGQEKENADFLAGKEIAIVSRDIKQLCAQTRDLLMNHRKREDMRQRAKSMQMVQAADIIVSHVISTLDLKYESFDVTKIKLQIGDKHFL